METTQAFQILLIQNEMSFISDTIPFVSFSVWTVSQI